MSNYNTTLQSNNTDLQAILNTINELPEAVEQATPVISVNTSGLITATAGTKSSTHQLAFQPAKTITPNTASQIAVPSGYYTGGDVVVNPVLTQSKGVKPTSTVQNVTPDKGYFLSSVSVNAIPSTYVEPSATKAAATYTPITVNQTISAGTYLTGDQTIKGDANLVAENIKSGVSIFGVAGTHSGSSSDASIDTCTVTITDFDDRHPMYVVTTIIDNNVETPYIRMGDIGTERDDLVIPPHTISNVKCGTVITILIPESSSDTPYVEVDGGATLIKACRASWISPDNRIALMYVFTAPETAGANANILVSYM